MWSSSGRRALDRGHVRTQHAVEMVAVQVLRSLLKLLDLESNSSEVPTVTSCAAAVGPGVPCCSWPLTCSGAGARRTSAGTGYGSRGTTTGHAAQASPDSHFEGGGRRREPRSSKAFVSKARTQSQRDVGAVASDVCGQNSRQPTARATTGCWRLTFHRLRPGRSSSKRSAEGGAQIGLGTLCRVMPLRPGSGHPSRPGAQPIGARYQPAGAPHVRSTREECRQPSPSPSRTAPGTDPGDACQWPAWAFSSWVSQACRRR